MHDNPQQWQKGNKKRETHLALAALRFQSSTGCFVSFIQGNCLDNSDEKENKGKELACKHDAGRFKLIYVLGEKTETVIRRLNGSLKTKSLARLLICLGNAALNNLLVRHYIEHMFRTVSKKGLI